MEGALSRALYSRDNRTSNAQPLRMNQLIQRQHHKDHREDDGCVKSGLLHAAAGLIKTLATSAEEPGRTRRTLLEQDERYDGDREKYLDNGKHDGIM